MRLATGSLSAQMRPPQPGQAPRRRSCAYGSTGSTGSTDSTGSCEFAALNSEGACTQARWKGGMGCAEALVVGQADWGTCQEIAV